MSNVYRPHQFAKKIGVSVSTVRRWDKEGRLLARRTHSNQRYYTDEDIRRVQQLPEPEKKTVVYCRVSSASQKDDLNSQLEAMQTFCLSSGVAVDDWITEVGSGMNFKRKKFTELMIRIENREIERLYLAHKDRLCRFGFDYFYEFAKRHDCDIIVVNQERLSPHQELVEDMLAIIHSFSSRLYGLRKYKSQIKAKITETE